MSVPLPDPDAPPVCGRLRKCKPFLNLLLRSVLSCGSPRQRSIHVVKCEPTGARYPLRPGPLEAHAATSGASPADGVLSCPGRSRAQVRSCSSSALARTSSLRMTATRATLPGSLGDELSVLRPQVRIAAHRGHGRHVEDSSHLRPAGLYEASALPSAGLSRDGGEPREAGRRLGVESAEFRHLDEQAGGGDAGHTRNGCQHLGPAGDHGVFGDPLSDLDIDGGQMPVELGHLRLVLALEQAVSNLLLAVECSRAVPDQCVTRHLEFLEGAACTADSSEPYRSHMHENTRSSTRMATQAGRSTRDSLERRPNQARSRGSHRSPGLGMR